MGIVDPI